MYKEIVYYIDTNLPSNLDTRRTFFQDCQVSTKQPKPVSQSRSIGLGPFSSSFHLMTSSLIPWEQLWARSWAEFVARSWAKFVMRSWAEFVVRRWVWRGDELGFLINLRVLISEFEELIYYIVYKVTWGARDLYRREWD